MHQFKEKVGKDRELASAALFYYPVLMAADVLAYRATEVPVGDDQRQHVELMREIARRFNARFGETLVVPGAGDPRGRRPDHGPAGAGAEDVDHRRDRAGDRPRPRRARRRSARSSARAVTDSGREVVRAPDKPGITNLIDILAVARGIDQAAVEERVRGRRLRRLQEGGRRGGGRVLAPVRERYAELRPDEAELERVLAARGREGAGAGRPGRRRRARAHGLRLALSPPK